MRTTRTSTAEIGWNVGRGWHGGSETGSKRRSKRRVQNGAL